MFPYQSLEALLAVVEARSFGAAAQLLHLTQSAVSQRISSLEEQIGERVLIRSTPPRLTEKGVKLVAHVRRVQALETELQAEENSTTPVARLGVNADSLATWFFDALCGGAAEDDILLQLVVDNEEHTLKRMREGEVLACITSIKHPLPGCDSHHLGQLSYKCCATRRFARKHFPAGLTKDSARTAPAVLFDEKDKMHTRFLAKHLGVQVRQLPHHMVPTSQGFAEIILRGLAYGVMPEPQARAHLVKGGLLDLTPGLTIEVPLYWHSPRAATKRERALRTRFISLSRTLLSVTKG